MTIQQYQAHVQQALDHAQTTCKRYTIGKDCELRVDQYKETKSIDPVFANAIDGIRLAQMRLKQPAT